MTPDQVCAARLVLARRALNWTQERMCRELEKVGISWSAPTLSNVERSINGRRIKEFSASEIVALAKATGFPVAWFFVPIAPDAFGLMPRIVPRESKLAVTSDELVDAVLGRRGDAVSEALTDAAPILAPITVQRLRETIEPIPDEPE
jgi:transcriptional regulator with XRE-family HTH domain